MSTTSKEIGGREMRPTGNLQGLPSGIEQKGPGCCWCPSMVLHPFSANVLCWRTPKNDFNKIQWVPKSQTNFSSVSIWWYQHGSTCKKS